MSSPSTSPASSTMSLPVRSALRRLHSPLPPLNTETPVPPSLTRRRPQLTHRGSSYSATSTPNNVSSSAPANRVHFPPSPSTSAAGCPDPATEELERQRGHHEREQRWYDNAEYSEPPSAGGHSRPMLGRSDSSPQSSSSATPLQYKQSRRTQSAPILPTLQSVNPLAPLPIHDIHLHHHYATTSSSSYGPASSIMAQVARVSQQQIPV